MVGFRRSLPLAEREGSRSPVLQYYTLKHYDGDAIMALLKMPLPPKARQIDRTVKFFCSQPSIYCSLTNVRTRLAPALRQEYAF
jgi:hypothetical protein